MSAFIVRYTFRTRFGYNRTGHPILATTAHERDLITASLTKQYGARLVQVTVDPYEWAPVLTDQVPAIGPQPGAHDRREP